MKTPGCHQLRDLQTKQLVEILKKKKSVFSYKFEPTTTSCCYHTIENAILYLTIRATAGWVN